MKNFDKIFFIGNLDSILFKKRIYLIIKNSKITNFKIVNTSRKKFKYVLWFILDSFIMCLHCLFFQNSKILFHGAYNSILWIIVFLRKNVIISILQGSELNEDYTNFRSILINLILKKSNLIVCRNNEQVDFLKIKFKNKQKQIININWGIKEDLFKLNRINNHKKIKIISPRATQKIYNIDIIFHALKKIKTEFKHVEFLYVEYNKNFELDNKDIIDKYIKPLDQNTLWKEILEADVCISIPSYDGFSNTVLESLSLGTFIILSDLDVYKDFKNKDFLTNFVKLTEDNKKNVDELYKVLKNVINKIDYIRHTEDKRRNFVKEKFSEIKNFDILIKAILDSNQNNK